MAIHWVWPILVTFALPLEIIWPLVLHSTRVNSRLMFPSGTLCQDLEGSCKSEWRADSNGPPMALRKRLLFTSKRCQSADHSKSSGITIPNAWNWRTCHSTKMIQESICPWILDAKMITHLQENCQSAQ